MAFTTWWRRASARAQQAAPRGGMAALLSAVVVVLGLTAPNVQAATVLRVLSWPGYADPDIVAVFEKRHGVKVEITTVASDDVLRAQLANTERPGF